MSDTPTATAKIEPDTDRIDRIVTALRESELDAVFCSLPSHVLLLTGYWPVMANTVALFTADGSMHLLLPEDEEEIAASMSVAQRTGFQPGSLSQITNTEKAIAQPFTHLVASLGLDSARIGLELRSTVTPASYPVQFHFGAILRDFMQEAFPKATLLPADDLLNRLSKTKTPHELDKLRLSCKIAQAAYEAGSAELKSGMTEPQAAEVFRSAYAGCSAGKLPVRTDGFFFCMSGKNSATACAAYARTRTRTLERGDLVMIHCNSQADGYWTDITRTYTCGEADAKQTAMRDAIFEAREAALARISPGVAAAEVDKAARDVLTKRGFGENFKHATGHGVCFSAANHDAIPRIHPKSTDVLEVGMTFNIEPAIYLDGYGGMRHCDVVAVTSQGAEVLTNFQSAASQVELAV